jgi:hypothetical protein
VEVQRINMTQDGETTTTGDALPGTGQPSGGEGNNPSKPQAKMYSEEDVGRRHAKLDKTIAQLNRELTEARQAGENTAAELQRRQKQIDDAEMERIGDDPAKLSVFQTHRAAQERIAKAEAKEREATRILTEVKAGQEALAADKAEIAVAKLASKYKIPVEDLTDLGITDPEALERVAVRLAAKRVTTTPKGGEDDFTTDSGLTSGGESEPTAEQLGKMSDKQYHDWASKRFQGR